MTDFLCPTLKPTQTPSIMKSELESESALGENVKLSIAQRERSSPRSFTEGGRNRVGKVWDGVTHFCVAIPRL